MIVPLRLHIRCALCARDVPLRGAIVAQHRGTTERLGVCRGSGAVPTPASILAWLDDFARDARDRAAEAERVADAAQRARADATAVLAWVGRRRAEIVAGALTGDFRNETLGVTTGEVRPVDRHPAHGARRHLPSPVSRGCLPIRSTP